MGYNTGEKVKWNWGDGKGVGEIKNVYTSKTTCMIKGSEITRNATKDCPAYYIVQDDGDEVLKLHSEVQKVS
ncbi:MAG: DUF2945 domain-containing protein [Alphaproteobacteria bacterium]